MSSTKERRLLNAINAVDQLVAEDANADLVISIHKFLGAKLHIEIPCKSTYARALVCQSMAAMVEARHYATSGSRGGSRARVA